jgi:hypothetical protein
MAITEKVNCNVRRTIESLLDPRKIESPFRIVIGLNELR